MIGRTFSISPNPLLDPERPDFDKMLCSIFKVRHKDNGLLSFFSFNDENEGDVMLAVTVTNSPKKRHAYWLKIPIKLLDNNQIPYERDSSSDVLLCIKNNHVSVNILTVDGAIANDLFRVVKHYVLLNDPKVYFGVIKKGNLEPEISSKYHRCDRDDLENKASSWVLDIINND